MGKGEKLTLDCAAGLDDDDGLARELFSFPHFLIILKNACFVMNFYTGLNILASLPKYSQMEEELDLITFLQLMGNALSLINIYLDISANDDTDEIDEDDADLELEILGFFQLLLASLNLFQVIIQHQDIAFFDEIRTAFIELLAPNEEVPRQPINFWPRLAARRSLFWWMTGFVPETLQEIVQEVAHEILQLMESEKQNYPLEIEF